MYVFYTSVASMCPYPKHILWLKGFCSAALLIFSHTPCDFHSVHSEMVHAGTYSQLALKCKIALQWQIHQFIALRIGRAFHFSYTAAESILLCTCVSALWTQAVKKAVPALENWDIFSFTIIAKLANRAVVCFFTVTRRTSSRSCM